MDWSKRDSADKFKLFKQRMLLSLEDHGITDKKKQSVKIKLAVGTEGLCKINNSGMSAEDQDDPEKLWKVFEDQLHLKVNYRIHRLEIMHFRQRPNETIDEFVNRCRAKGVECEFDNGELAERIIELVIASTTDEKFQDTLLNKPKGFTIGSTTCRRSQV